MEHKMTFIWKARGSMSFSNIMNDNNSSQLHERDTTYKALTNHIHTLFFHHLLLRPYEE